MGSGPLDRIDHFVVLMLENRSFDNLLGWLYDPSNPPPYDRVPEGGTFDGVSGKDLHNPVPPAIPGPRSIPVGRAVHEMVPNPCPAEEYPRVNMQLYGTLQEPEKIYPAPMRGFVEDYATTLGERGITPTEAACRQIMQCYTPEGTPVLSALARSYAVSDRWFSSVPTMTMANRSFLHAATSRGFVLNTPYSQWLQNTAPTIFNRLEERGLPWKVYYDPFNVVPLAWLMHRSLEPFWHGRFVHLGEFYEDCRRGVLPAYAFLEPRFLLRPNDMHPPHPIPPGEELVRAVYEAVREGPLWDRTLLIVTFDEHGGCYDHVPPPPAVPPGDGATCPEGFRFNRLGVRVPTILISPWIREGTILHGVNGFDHTSIIRTLSRRFGLSPLTDRDRAAEDLESALNLPEMRTDEPQIPIATQPLAVFPVDGEEASDLHRAMVGLTATRAGLGPRSLWTVADAHAELQRIGKDILPPGAL